MTVAETVARAVPGGAAAKGGAVAAILSIVVIVVRVISRIRYRNTVMARYFKRGYR
ncbi:MAG: hypothetical protein JWP66_223 [Naasia sp.]|nr:hypothetical protein [Naasia sp.]